MVTDNLFKSADIKQRRIYVDLVDSVKLHGGTVLIFSSMHVSGAQLDKFTGVAAILRFPCPETAEMVVVKAGNCEDSDDSSSEDSSESSGDTSDFENDSTDPFSRGCRVSGGRA
jgi:protein pelota